MQKTFGLDTAWAQSSTKEIRANKFVLEDENGKIRAELYAAKDKGGGLSLYDENGKLRAVLGAGKEGTALVLMDDKPVARIALGAGTNKDEPSLSLRDEKGEEIWSAP
jgi:hypothetical protein